jgi:hypothetical protein
MRAALKLGVVSSPHAPPMKIASDQTAKIQSVGIGTLCRLSPPLNLDPAARSGDASARGCIQAHQEMADFGAQGRIRTTDTRIFSPLL